MLFVTGKCWLSWFIREERPTNGLRNFIHNTQATSFGWIRKSAELRNAKFNFEKGAFSLRFKTGKVQEKATQEVDNWAKYSTTKFVVQTGRQSHKRRRLWIWRIKLAEHQFVSNKFWPSSFRMQLSNTTFEYNFRMSKPIRSRWSVYDKPGLMQISEL